MILKINPVRPENKRLYPVDIENDWISNVERFGWTKNRRKK